MIRCERTETEVTRPHVSRPLCQTCERSLASGVRGHSRAYVEAPPRHPSLDVLRSSLRNIKNSLNFLIIFLNSLKEFCLFKSFPIFSMSFLCLLYVLLGRSQIFEAAASEPPSALDVGDSLRLWRLRTSPRSNSTRSKSKSF